MESMLRIVWFHPRSAFPARGGGEVRLQGLLQGALMAGHRVMLVLPATNDLRDLDQGLDVVEVAGPRGLALAGSKIVSRHPLRSPRIGRAERRRIQRQLDDFNPDVGVVSDLFSWPLATHLMPRTLPWIYDSHNVESRLYAQLKLNSKSLFDRVTFSIDSRRVAHDELNVLQLTNGVSAVSRSDAEEYRHLAPHQCIRVVPSSVQRPDRPSDPGAALARGLFIGTLDYPPNEEAVIELITKVWPLVRSSSSNARLMVAGRRPSHTLRSLMSTFDWVDFYEDAPSLEPLYGIARCVVLPIRSGGGTRLKVYEALAHGVPLIGTPVALSGVGLTPGHDCLEVESSGEIAAAVVALMSDPDEADRLGGAGRQAFDDRLSWAGAGQPRMLSLLDDVVTEANRPPR